jgi:hypothetical protein
MPQDWTGKADRPGGAELQVLDTLFYDEDQDRQRMFDLAFADILRGEPLTDDEAQELAELERRYPPDPKFYDPAMEEAIRQARERLGLDR